MGLWTHNGVWKCLVHAEESVLLQVACAGPLTWIAQNKKARLLLQYNTFSKTCKEYHNAVKNSSI